MNSCGSGNRRVGRASLGSFTLVEMILAIGILSILVIMLASMLGALTSAWQDGEAHNERRTVAQAALDKISRELSIAAFPVQRTTNGLQMVINPPTVSSAYEYPHAAFWQAPVATDGGTNGNLAVVGYFIQWTNLTPCLSRVLINPSSSDYAVYTSPNQWISDALIQAHASLGNNYAGLMAENVLGIWVQPLDPNGNPIQQTLPNGPPETFDSRYPYAYTNHFLAGWNWETNTSTVSAPASVQVAVAVMDSRTAKLLTAIPTSYRSTYPPTAGSLWSDIQYFYAGLPKVIQKGTEIQMTTVNLADAPH